jgi:acyl-CoA dehydrogenase
MLSGRFADALSHLYVASAVLKAYEDAGRPHGDWPLVEWSLRYCLYHCQEALAGVLRNFPIGGIGGVVRALVFPLGRRLRYPDDRLGRQAAELLLEPGETRERLTAGMYVDDRPDDVTGRIEHALRLALEAEPIERRLRKHRIEQPVGSPFSDWTAQLVADGTLAEHEAEVLTKWHAAHRAAIDVDDFGPGELVGQAGPSGGRTRQKTAANKSVAKKKAASAKKAGSAKKAAANKSAAKKNGAQSETSGDDQARSGAAGPGADEAGSGGSGTS